jgi:hypothetical protein
MELNLVISECMVMLHPIGSWIASSSFGSASQQLIKCLVTPALSRKSVRLQICPSQQHWLSCVVEGAGGAACTLGGIPLPPNTRRLVSLCQQQPRLQQQAALQCPQGLPCWLWVLLQQVN